MNANQPLQKPSKKPLWRDYVLFYLLVPLFLSVFFASFGIRLIAGMPFLDALAYMMIHLAAAWWGLDIGCRLIHWLCRYWQPPPSAIIVMGFFIMLVPLTFFYQALGDVYAARYTSFAEARSDTLIPAWSLDYVLHFLRFSATAVPMFMAAVYGYEYVTGVGWYRYGRASSKTLQPIVEEPVTSSEEGLNPPLAQILSNTQLPDNAVLLAIKAEEHYIRVWSNEGTDLIRYRFQDVADLLVPYSGIRVHRSWWVNLSAVKRSYKKGRSLELELNNELVVPVSLAYKAAVIAALEN